MNGAAAFTVTLTSSEGKVTDFPIAAASATPQGVVDAINAANLGYSAQLVQETSGTAPFKVSVFGTMGGASFTVTAANAAGTKVADLSFSSSGSGIAGDTLRKITTWLSTTSPLTTQSATATSQNTKYAAALTALKTRMDDMLARYTKQFSAMESLVGSINSQKTSCGICGCYLRSGFAHTESDFHNDSFGIRKNFSQINFLLDIFDAMNRPQAIPSLLLALGDPAPA